MLSRQLLAFLLLSCTSLAGCGSDSDAPEGGDEVEAAYLLMHTVESPEGRLNYVQASSTLSIGELDDSKGLEVAGPSRAFAIGGAAFLADAETLKVRKFNVGRGAQLKAAGEVSFANFGITYFDTGFTFIDDEHAWYMASDVLKVIQFDPSLMEVTGSFDVSEVKHPTLQTYVDGGLKVGDNVFAGVWYYTDDDSSLYGDVAEVKVAVLSTTEQKLVKVITDDRCSTAGVAAKLPNDDLLVVGVSGHLRLFGNPPTPPNCLLRIKAGETEFDPDFVQYFDDMTAPSVDGSGFVYAKELGGGMLWARDPGDFDTIDDFYLSSRWEPFLVDTDGWTAEPLDIPGLESTGGPGGTQVIDGKVYFNVSRSDGEPGGAFASFADGELTEEILYSEWLQTVARIR